LNNSKWKKKKKVMMPELVAMVLSHVDHPSLVACSFVWCTTWKPPARSTAAVRRQDYCRQAAATC
jgi:hypothetical protein